MDLNLTGKKALVTGASRGIGLATVEALLAEGVSVIGCSRGGSRELADSGASMVCADLSELSGGVELADQVARDHGDLDILVNNVGGSDADSDAVGGFLDIDDRLWGRSFDLNFFAAVRTSRAMLPGLLRRGGVIVNVSSIGARMPGEGPMPYTTAKAAVNAFGKALAEEYGPQGVRVLTVSPGPTRTSIWTNPDGFAGAVAAAQGVTHEKLLQAVPAAAGMHSGRLLDPAQIASLVTYVASPQASGMTGHDYPVDDGAIKTI